MATGVQVRGARAGELALVRSLIQAAFSEDEADLWDCLVSNDQAFHPEGVRVAVVDDRPVACALALPRKVRGRWGWLPGAVITLVCTHPDHRLRGYGAATVRDALAWVTDRGGAISILYGVPTFYPRFGFVPVLPRLETSIAVGAVPDWGGRTAPLTQADIPAVVGLYSEHLAGYPLAVARDAQPWQWRFREVHRDGRAVLVSDQREGYAVVVPDRDHETLNVTEAAAGGRHAACRLLSGLAGEARARGLRKLRLLEPPCHLMTRLALVCGAEQTHKPAAAGMAFVNSWPQVLPPQYGASTDGLCHRGRLILRCTHTALVQLALGYRTVDDLLLIPDCGPADRDVAVVADGTQSGAGAESEAVTEMVRRDFPPRWPRWHLAPYW